MKKIILYFIICLFTIGCASTNKIYNDITTFQLKKITSKEIPQIEENQNGIEKITKVNISQGYFPELNVYEFSQPKIYNRKIGNVNTAVSYFFTAKDSVVRVISYAWNEQDDNNFVQEIFDTNKKLFPPLPHVCNVWSSKKAKPLGKRPGVYSFNLFIVYFSSITAS